MAIRLTGMSSGLDTEAIVTQLVSAYSSKKDKYVKAQTKLSWKQDAWKSLNTKIYSFYKSLDNMRFSTNYKTKSAKVSDESKVTVSASASAMNGTQTLEVDQVAKSGYLTGGKLKSGANANSTLADLGFSGDGTIAVKVGNTTKNIKVSASTKISDFVSSLNSSGVTASFDSKNGRIFVAAKSTGTASDFSITAGNADGMKALSALGLNAKGSSADMAAYEAFAAYAQGVDAGGNVVDYFQKNADGTLKKDQNGNYLKASGVTYDAEKTQEYVETIRKNVWDKSAENHTLSQQLGYANAYEGIENVKKTFESSGEAGNWDTFTKLLTMADASSVYVDADGNTYEADKITSNEDGKFVYTAEDGTETTFEQSELTHGAVRLAELETAAGLAVKNVDDGGAISYAVDGGRVNALTQNLHTVEVYEADTNNAARAQAIKDAYTNGTLDDDKAAWNTTIRENQAYLDEHALLSNDTESPEFLAGRIDAAVNALENPSYSEGATKVNGQDAVITLNGAQYTSGSNEVEVNGLTITALGKTNGEVTLTVDNDVSGLYDKVKNFFKSYNELINEMTSLYNADSAKGYEPLTDDEKEAMTEKEIEKWEEKIKGSLLRRDGTLSGVLNVMTMAMSKQYNINGKNYSLSSFGISTLGYMNAEKNQHYAYHIDGDADDTASGSKADKLMAALKSDPDSVIQFMQQLTEGLYKEIDKKMKSTTMKSIYNVYNDKEMASEYSDYTTTISKWEDKVADMEDSYYKKFSAMEKALAKLQSQQSALGNLFT